MHEDIKWFLGFILVIGILAYGGFSAKKNDPSGSASQTVPEEIVSSEQNSGQQSRQPSPEEKRRAELERVQAEANRIAEELKKAAAEANRSPLYGKLSISSVRPGHAGGTEQVLIQASPGNTAPIPITGLRIQGARSRLGAELPIAWRLPFPGIQGGGETVTLKPAERAYVITGRSANGQSFQLNRCTGFFEQTLNFTPSLPLSCPHPVNGPLPEPPNELSDQCLDFLQTLPSCSAYAGAFPPPVREDGSCQRFVRENFTYDRCVSIHKDRPGFYSGEWRLYLNRGSPLFPHRHDTVELVDQNGKLISSYNY